MNYWRKKTEAVIALVGGQIENNSGPFDWDFNFYAPAHYVWSCDGGLHCLVANTAKGDKAWSDDMWKDAYGRVTFGTEPCPFGDGCEWCYPDDDE